MGVEKKSFIKFDEALILTLYLALKPLYLSSSGSMQICDILFVIGTVYVLARRNFSIKIASNEQKIVRALFIFTLYVFIVNFAWFIFTSFSSDSLKYSFLKNTLYYVFNLFAVVLCILIAEKVGIDRAIDAICRGCTLSAAVNLTGIIINSGKQFRELGFFNNPNQLGFYAIIILTFLLYFRDRFKSWERILIFLTSVYSTVVSLSKAAFICLFAVCFMYLIVMKKISASKLLVRCFLLFAVAIILYLFLYTDIVESMNVPKLLSMKRRILNMTTENDSNLAVGRGYNRVYEMNYNIFWGMGEGEYRRFATIPGYEIHSTYVNLLVSYGAIGCLLFLNIVVRFFAVKRWAAINIAYLSGVLLYGITHNGIRNTLFWILISFVWLYQSKSKPIPEKQTD